MKKTLLLLLLVTSITALSQVKKTPIKKKITESETVMANALKWFKDVYVENNFKDPYSYKVLKSTIIPVTLKEGLDRLIEDTERAVKKTDTADWLSDYKIKKREYYKSERFHKGRFSEADTLKPAYLTSKKILDYELKNVNLEAKKHFSHIAERDSLIKLKSAITNQKGSEIFYYIVYIDCYSNNSYGNPVLGRYSFHYGTKGLVRDPIQLNKD